MYVCATGVAFGADDFLPCLTWVLLRSDVVTLQIDTVYMMELLDPSQLQGEGRREGYGCVSEYRTKGGREETKEKRKRKN